MVSYACLILDISQKYGFIDNSNVFIFISIGHQNIVNSTAALCDGELLIQNNVPTLAV